MYSKDSIFSLQSDIVVPFFMCTVQYLSEELESKGPSNRSESSIVASMNTSSKQ